MKHFYIDQYANLNSLVHRLDTRIKTIGTFLFIFLVVLTPLDCKGLFLLYSGVVVGLIYFSRLPIKFVFKRSLVIIPFVLLVSIVNLFHQPEIFLNILVKSYLSILVMIILTASTEFTRLMKALEALKVPRLFIMILSFMYRYIFLIHDEILKMLRAKKSRAPKISHWRNIKTLANMIGVLFIRSYERSENVYLAMCARGFDGKIRTIDDHH